MNDNMDTLGEIGLINFIFENLDLQDIIDSSQLEAVYQTSTPVIGSCSLGSFTIPVFLALEKLTVNLTNSTTITISAIKSSYPNFLSSGGKCDVSFDIVYRLH